jgi:hypothetical protein
LIHEEIESRLNSNNLCCHAFPNLLSPCLLSKNINIKIHRTIFLPVVLFECETWSLAVKEQHTLRVFENRVLRRICGPKRDDIVGGWRKLHEELHYLYSLPNQVTEDEMGWACIMHGEEQECV